MDWQTEARRRIAAIHASMPEATPDELRRALRKEASNFHCGTSWGKKTWGKRCREYLAKMTGNGHYRGDGRDQVWPDHITFPFRKENL